MSQTPRARALSLTHIHVHVRTYHVYICGQGFTHIHTYIHTHVCTHIYICVKDYPREAFEVGGRRVTLTLVFFFRYLNAVCIYVN